MEITRQNFPSVLTDFEEKIRTCSFISLDLELSGLRTKPGYVNRLFDTATARYNKYREGTVGIVITQIGLSLFHHDIEKNTYTSSTYTFHLTPQTFGSINQLCTFEASVFDFLEKNKFDFNKFAYEGIPYLNKNEEIIVEKLISQEATEKHLRYEDVEEFWVIKSKVEKWLETASNGDIYKLKLSTLSRLFTAKQFIKSFPYLKVSIFNDEIIIEKPLPDRSKSENFDIKSFDQIIFQYVLGFSQVVKMLEKYRKPLVFHNAFGDILFFYNQFIEPLPASYKKFKQNLNELFPHIYDNKFIFNKLKNGKHEYVFDNTSLQNVYTYFKEKNGRFIKLHSPAIKFEDGFEATPWFHHAGWDAYCTGFCFVRICHWIGCENLGTTRILTSIEHQSAVKQYCNKVYLSRAAQPYILLGGADPATHRPRHLHIKALRKDTIDISEVVEITGKYGSVDVKRYGKKTALVAVTGSFSAKKILQTLKNSKDFKVSYYSVLKHSPVMRLALWSGFIVSSGGLLALLFNQLKK